jgi:hypothetical protein
MTCASDHITSRLLRCSLVALAFSNSQTLAVRTSTLSYFDVKLVAEDSKRCFDLVEPGLMLQVK